MSRRSWKRSEIEFLVENYSSMTTDELCRELSGRSKKSINRKLEKLRDEGRIGHRDKDTVKRAYYQRGRNSGDEKPAGSGRKGRGRLPTEDYGYEEV